MANTLNCSSEPARLNSCRIGYMKKILSALLVLACFSGLTRVSFAQMNDSKSAPGLQTAVFGGGCFWCLDAQFKLVNGVKSVLSGYAGGTTKNPSYEEVCSETTGHAEVIAMLSLNISTARSGAS